MVVIRHDALVRVVMATAVVFGCLVLPMPILVASPGTVGSALAVVVVAAAVVLGVRTFRLAVEVRSDVVVVRGFLRTWTVPRGGITAVTDYATLVWHDDSGRVRSTPMLAMDTGSRDSEKSKYRAALQREALRQALGVGRR